LYFFGQQLFGEISISVGLAAVFAYFRHSTKSHLGPNKNRRFAQKPLPTRHPKKRENSLSGANETNSIGKAAVDNAGTAAEEVHEPRIGRASGAGRTRPEKRR